MMDQEPIYDNRLTSSEKRQSRSSSRHENTIKEFTIDLFVKKNLICEEDLKPILEMAQQQHGVKKVFLNQKKQIPEMEGCAFSLEDFGENKLGAKCDASFSIIQTIEQRLTKGNILEIFLLIPEGIIKVNLGIVSYLIGSKGGQIKKIMHETKATIVVNQPIYKYAPRTVKIEGDSQKIYSAIKLITKKIAERGVTEDDYAKVAEQLDSSKINTKAKLVYQGNIAEYVIKNKSEIEHKSDVSVKQKNTTNKIKHLKFGDKVIQIEGKLKNISSAVQAIIKRISGHFAENENIVKIVMPSSFASKLIGAGGCLVQEIAKKAKGAQIKVLSDKDEKTDPDTDCLVEVKGNTQSKQEACVLILEQIECFKNGGPVRVHENKILESGKFINDNFNKKLRNSVQPIEQERQRKHTRSSSSDSYRDSRSRSSSRRKSKKRISPNNRKYKNAEYSSYSPRFGFMINNISFPKGRKGNNQRQTMIQTTIMMPTRVIDQMDKYKKLRKLNDEHRVKLKISDSRNGQESTVDLDGELKDCIAVIEVMLLEQSKMIRK